MKKLFVAAFGAAFARWVRKWLIRFIGFMAIVAGATGFLIKAAFGWEIFFVVAGLLLFCAMLQPAVNKAKLRPPNSA